MLLGFAYLFNVVPPNAYSESLVCSDVHVYRKIRALLGDCNGAVVGHYDALLFITCRYRLIRLFL